MPRWLRILFVLGIAAIAIAAMAALWGISGFRADVRELAASSGDAAFAARAETAIRYEQIIMFGILAISILLTTLNLGLFRRGKDGEG
ncbi:MAG: hypothetical protein AB7V13_24085 [Pseudorhodoplanes sp.]|uniref:hypothetical protein n=1 Tax=Pseudorhodoplanes sp. TaxID=1934341 RepID=UPI003D0E78F9